MKSRFQGREGKGGSMGSEGIRVAGCESEDPCSEIPGNGDHKRKRRGPTDVAGNNLRKYRL